MKTFKFKNMSAFDKHLEKLVSEGLEKAKNSLFEAPPAPPIAQPPVAPPAPAPAAAPTGDISLNGAPEGGQAPGQPEELTVFTIIDQLNLIRSGQSLKDKALSEQMHTYFEALAPEEQQQLYKYLQGISAIVNPPNDAAMAPDPNQPGMALNSPPPAAAPSAPPAPAPAAPPAAPPAPKKVAAPAPMAPPRPQEDPELPIRVKRNVP